MLVEKISDDNQGSRGSWSSMAILCGAGIGHGCGRAQLIRSARKILRNDIWHMLYNYCGGK